MGQHGVIMGSTWGHHWVNMGSPLGQHGVNLHRSTPAAMSRGRHLLQGERVMNAVAPSV